MMTLLPRATKQTTFNCFHNNFLYHLLSHKAESKRSLFNCYQGHLMNACYLFESPIKTSSDLHGKLFRFSSFVSLFSSALSLALSLSLSLSHRQADALQGPAVSLMADHWNAPLTETSLNTPSSSIVTSSSNTWCHFASESPVQLFTV